MARGYDPWARVLRNLVTLQRIGTTVSASVNALWSELAEQIIEDLVRIDPTGPSAERYRRLRTARLIEAVEERVRDTQPAIYRTLRDQLAQVAVSQGHWAEATLVASLGEVGKRVRPSPVSLALAREILTGNPFGEPGKGVALLREWSDGLSASTLRNVRNRIRSGMLQEASIDEMVRMVRGTRVAGGTGFSGGVIDLTTRQTEALVRTAVNFTTTQAHEAVYADNAALLMGLRFTATLDDRTTLLCGSLDGTVYAMDAKDRPTLPLHWNCRSVYVPEPDWGALGLDPPPDGPRFERDLSGVSPEDLGRKVSARRRTGDLGQSVKTSANRTYEDWLRSQSRDVQEHILGKGRAAIFRGGGKSLSQLIREDGSVIPLRDLL